MEFISLVVTFVIGILIFGFALNSYFRGLKIDNFTDKYVLITGCDTGIGNVAARKLDALGFHVFAGCLATEKAHELGSVCSDRLVPLQMDVTQEESVKKAKAVVKEVLPEGMGLWAVINNAGVFGPVGFSQWFSKSKFEETINVNFLGLVCVTTTFLPLIRRAKGRIVNMSSVLGRVALFAGPYTVSKYCVEGYTDWLRYQLIRQGITVVTVEPGGLNSNITNEEKHMASLKTEMASLSDEMKDLYDEESTKRFRQIVRLACRFYSLFKVDTAADVYIHAVSARYPKTRYVFGLDSYLIFRPMWTLPTWFTDLLASVMYPRPKSKSKQST